jgi:hypothetical protein
MRDHRAHGLLQVGWEHWESNTYPFWLDQLSLSESKPSRPTAASSGLMNECPTVSHGVPVGFPLDQRPSNAP